MTRRHAIALTLMMTCLAIAFTLDLVTGSVSISPVQVVRILTGGPVEKESWVNIIWLFRLPKALTAVLAGAGLAISGLLMQILFRNPLAGPSVLGISAGASMGVALVVLSTASGGVGLRFIAGLGLSGKAAMVLASAMGGGLVLSLVLALARKVRDVMTILLIGVLVGFAINAAVSVLIHFSSPERVQAYVAWTFGSFSAVNRQDFTLFAPVIILGIVAGFFMHKPLTALLLGENYAASMGLRVRPFRYPIIGVTAILAGTTTAYCGPVAFIGMAVPHLARMIMGTLDNRILIPATALTGAIIALSADALAQLPGSQAILPLNAVTALIGSPVIVWLILKGKPMV